MSTKWKTTLNRKMTIAIMTTTKIENTSNKNLEMKMTSKMKTTLKMMLTIKKESNKSKKNNYCQILFFWGCLEL